MTRLALALAAAGVFSLLMGSAGGMLLCLGAVCVLAVIQAARDENARKADR